MDEIVEKLKYKNVGKRIAMLIFSLFFSAIVYNLFLLPVNLVTGGSGGIATITNYVYGIDPALMILIVSLICALLSFMYLGTRVTAVTILASIIYPFFVEITEPLVNIVKIDYSDMFIITIFAGVLNGIANGLMYKTGYNNGGLPVISQILEKYYKIPIATTSAIINITVVLIGGVFFGWTNVMYAIILIYLNTIIINKVLLGISNNKAFYIIVYLILIGILLYVYRDSLSNMFDYMMNNLFIIIYFPNLAIYIAAILITNIIIWISIFNNKVPKIIKKINITVYCIITYILVLILNIINENKLDVFSQTSVYGNTKAQALIELTSTIFIVWILFLLVYKFIKPYFFKEPVKKKVIIKKVVKKPDNYKPIEAPYQVKASNNVIKVEKRPVENTSQYSDLLTIDDYKLLLNILKEQKEKEKLEKERQERVDKEQAKYRELQDLYRSVR